ncbi:MAG TPA: valine--tRNA ligase, partial [Gemmatales bacterium]|nr:valine--tRNA ligase [Gemmatales bacterium]
MDLPKQFDPQEAQQRWLQFWHERGYYHSDPDPARRPFTIVIPPPNVTGALHLGHGINDTLQDTLIRWRRMQGRNALYLPGTDHAGIATQAVVERRILETEKKTRHDLGREELVRRIWEWKEQYEARILDQLKQMGFSCDWRRTRFTFDDQCSRAVRLTFFNLFRAGLIYRGKRLVNWDAQLQTSVADDETYSEDVKGGFWTFQYPVLAGNDPDAAPTGAMLSFSTTRPETMLGDVALCVHPNDERYRHLVGQWALQPLVRRAIPIIADGQLADPTLGTGCVKVTPAHDPNDYACWQRQPHIGMINILNPDGTLNEQAGRFAGLDRLKAREEVTAAMEALGLFLGREDRIIPLKYSDRSKTPIEPLLSDQWFVRMGDAADGTPGLAQRAMDAVTDGQVRFHPERYAKSYLDWLGEKRDWCISRQLWWGHQIPVWSKAVIPIPAEILAQLKELDSEIQDRSNKGGASEELEAANVRFQRFLADSLPMSVDNVVTVRLQQYEIDKSNCLHAKAQIDLEAGTVVLHACVAPGFPEIEAELERQGFSQEEDVLDTWFSSALWPHSTLGWPEKTPEMAYYYPTNVLVTSRDIITLWVARMVIFSQFNLGQVPFHDVYIHPKILDGFGETMSKSKGNGVDPLDIIGIYGVDALRYGLCQMATETQDARLPVANVCPHCQNLVPVKAEHMYMRTKKVTCPSCKKAFRPGGPWPTPDPELPTAKQSSERFELGRNFANKLWNATRFVLPQLADQEPRPLDPAKLPVEDRWILSRLAQTAQQMTTALEAFRIAEAARLIYDFAWSEFCDWYLEMAKTRLRGTASEAGGDAAVRSVLVAVLDGIVRLLHPLMPFVTESIWQALGSVAPRRGVERIEPAAASVMIAPWPDLPEAFLDPATDTAIGRMQGLVRGIRNLRNEFQVEEKAAVSLMLTAAPAVTE